MSGGTTRKVSPSEAMRDMLSKMAYLALCYAVKGQRKQAEVMRRMARQLHREYREAVPILSVGRSS